MATQIELKKSNQLVEALHKGRTFPWLLVFGILLVISLVGVAVMVIPSMGVGPSTNRSALEAISARYQAKADSHAVVVSERALDILSTRYNGMAGLYGMKAENNNGQALAVLSSRYQGMADTYARGNGTNALSALGIISSRYTAQQKVEALRVLSLVSARYQGMADAYASLNRTGSISSLQIISARYQEQAERYQIP